MAQGDNKRFWQNHAGIYGAVVRTSSGKTYDAVCERIRARLTPDMYVLELACGTGQLSFPLGASVALWEATDFSEAMIRQTQKIPHSDRLRFSVQNAESLPFEHSTFDAAVISNALHIMPRPERALKELHRVLKPGGILFSPTYIHGGMQRPSLRARIMNQSGFRVYHPWNAAELRAFIESYGYEVESEVILTDSVAPLCYIEARSTKE